jgi:hypothetical protein
MVAWNFFRWVFLREASHGYSVFPVVDSQLEHRYTCDLGELIRTRTIVYSGDIYNRHYRIQLLMICFPEMSLWYPESVTHLSPL